MVKSDSIDIDVQIRISDETVDSCVAILNMWLRERGHRIVVYEKEDGTPYMEVM